ncbi:ABC transporter permease subunit, partial [Aeromonas veronii]|uniref:ABC transporter permease subunit n=1 Tax=Aeromonas veronii TaxID=654 RepID=UPI00406C7123
FVTPILLAALGGAICERSGVFNIALEGMMLAGAFAAVMGAFATGSPYAGAFAAAMAGIFLATVFAEFSLRRGGDPIVVSIAINLLAFGMTTFLLHAVSKTAGAFNDPSITG